MFEPLPLSDLLKSWVIGLKAARKSPSTLRSYEAGVRLFLAFLAEEGLPPELTKANVLAYLASMSEHEPATASNRLAALKRFARWLADEEGFDATAVLAITPPKLDQKAVASVSDDELRSLLKACAGADLRDKRDKAMVTLFAETGLRASELLNLTIADLDLPTTTAHVVRGKGGKGRRVKFSASCAAVLDRYLRARRAAGNPADRGPLWVSPKGALGYPGLVYSLGLRAQIAGVKDFHVHRLRHSMAVKWLKAGGSEVGLMSQAGWTSRTMISRYTKASGEALAAAEFDRLNLGIEQD
ncbi:tyrosine-type recombinase/integrase [Mycobacterium sp. RTGN5]|uniref:tyrosine-type recombinase/integrase n=1 Tax=Mycobacterium sp. RTGN5 TaxID=3016522 RepID=UPI0029C875C5|nr:tyrosine-type recombinase/integrase [Mycobacterium sp. RTGN5]